jgi:capping protein alpha
LHVLTFDLQNAESTGRAVSAAIEKFECEFHKQVEEFYVNMNQNTFKAMRRFLPVSRKPMEWNSSAHKLAADLNK